MARRSSKSQRGPFAQRRGCRPSALRVSFASAVGSFASPVGRRVRPSLNRVLHHYVPPALLSQVVGLPSRMLGPHAAVNLLRPRRLRTVRRPGAHAWRTGSSGFAMPRAAWHVWGGRGVVLLSFVASRSVRSSRRRSSHHAPASYAHSGGAVQHIVPGCGPPRGCLKPSRGAAPASGWRVGGRRGAARARTRESRRQAAA